MRVFILEDRAAPQPALSESLGRLTGVHIVGKAQDVGGAITALARLEPDILIFDLHLAEGREEELVRAIESARCRPCLLVLANEDRPQDVEKSLQLGADLFLDKAKNPQALAQSLKEAFTCPSANGSTNHVAEFLSLKRHPKHTTPRSAADEALRPVNYVAADSDGQADRAKPFVPDPPDFIERFAIPMAVLTLSGRFANANSALLAFFGCQAADLEQATLSQFTHPVDRLSDCEPFQELVAGTRDSYQIEKRYRRRDGSVISGRLTATLLRGADLAPRSILAHIEDITAYKLAEEKRRASLQRYENLLEAIGGVVWECDAYTMQLTFISPQIERLVGYPVADWLTQPGFWAQRIHPEDQDRVLGASVIATDARRNYEVEYRLLTADGRLMWVRDYVSVVAEPGAQICLRGIMLNITGRKEVELALQRREEHFRCLIENALDVITILDADGTIRFQSPSVEQVQGYTPGEMIGQSIYGMIHPEDCGLVRAELAQATEHPGKRRAFEFRARRKDGAWCVVEALAKAILDDEDQPAIIINARDMTERNQLQEQCRHAQKMDAVGRLAGGVAHDFNNLLTVINGYGELLGDLIKEQPACELLAEIRRAGDRAATLTRQLLAFSRRQVLAPQVLDLNRIVRQTEGMLRRLIGEDSQLVMQLLDGLAPVRVDPNQIEHVLINLAVNARDAMPRGGVLSMATREVEISAGDEFPMPELPCGPYVLLAVSDTGHGMDEAVKARIFEPFFTTKEPGRGTGLGLATAYGIIKQSGGAIKVRSAPGKGTTFEIYLPRQDRVATCLRDAPNPPEFPRGSETVLVVEDQDEVRKFTVASLRAGGYTVFEASSGDEALRLSNKYPDEIHLLLTDVVMPCMNGHELAERLLRDRQTMKVLFVSGHTDDAMLRHGVRQAQTNFLQKPLSSSALARKVRGILDECPLAPTE